MSAARAAVTMLGATLALAASGCSTIGNVGEFADPVSTAGAGPFRIVDKYETAIDGEPENAVVMVGGDGMSSGVSAGDFLFFAAAEANLVPPERDPSLASHEVDFARFAPRTIRRAASNGRVTAANCRRATTASARCCSASPAIRSCRPTSTRASPPSRCPPSVAPCRPTS